MFYWQVNKTILTLVLSSLFFLSFAQEKEQGNIDYNCEGNFANTGEAEQCWAERFFRNEYKKKRYKKFGSEILKSENTFIFGSDKFEVINTDVKLLSVFSRRNITSVNPCRAFQQTKGKAC